MGHFKSADLWPQKFAQGLSKVKNAKLHNNAFPLVNGFTLYTLLCCLLIHYPNGCCSEVCDSIKSGAETIPEFQPYTHGFSSTAFSGASARGWIGGGAGGRNLSQHYDMGSWLRYCDLILCAKTLNPKGIFMLNRVGMLK